MRIGADPPQARRALRQFLESGCVVAGLVDDRIAQSWRRCRRIGIEHSNRLPFDPVDGQELASARELNRVAMLDGEDTIEVRHLPHGFLEDVEPATHPQAQAPDDAAAAQRRATLEEQETEAIGNALKSHGGNVSAAARALGISRNTIYRRLDGLKPLRSSTP
jgi:transcriptional regulator of acetoin/glycerol metabolism